MYSEFRKYHRYNVFATALVRTTMQGEYKRLSTQVNTISQRGMGLYTTYPLTQRTPVSVELSFVSPADDQKNVIEGSIASLVKENDHYFMGIEFSEVIPHETFMRLIKLDY